MLEQLIAQELMVQEMSRLGMDVTEGDVDQALDDIGRRNGVDRARLKQEVERSGLVWSTYREGITQELRQMKFDQVVLQPRISVSEDELESLYREKVDGAEGGRVLDGIFALDRRGRCIGSISFRGATGWGQISRGWRRRLG